MQSVMRCDWRRVVLELVEVGTVPAVGSNVRGHVWGRLVVVKPVVAKPVGLDAVGWFPSGVVASPDWFGVVV